MKLIRFCSSINNSFCSVVLATNYQTVFQDQLENSIKKMLFTQALEINSILNSLFNRLPYDIIRKIVTQTRTITVFRISKLFASFMEDQEFWAVFARYYTKQPFLQHYSEAPPLTAFRFPPTPTSWRTYTLFWTMNEVKKKEPKSLFVKTPYGKVQFCFRRAFIKTLDCHPPGGARYV
jgi:hypothetical protein